MSVAAAFREKVTEGGMWPKGKVMGRPAILWSVCVSECSPILGSYPQELVKTPLYCPCRLGRWVGPPEPHSTAGWGSWADLGWSIKEE